MKCLNCGKNTNNPKFCSRSCSQTYNNKLRPKKKYFCKKCGRFLYEGFNTKYTTLCNNCNPQNINWDTITYGELLDRRIYQAHSHIRDIARRVYAKSNKPKYCANCGYDKHYEICHIKAIESYDKTTPIASINNIHNLIALCPNCHWELDNGYLECKEEWK